MGPLKIKIKPQDLNFVFFAQHVYDPKTLKTKKLIIADEYKIKTFDEDFFYRKRKIKIVDDLLGYFYDNDKFNFIIFTFQSFLINYTFFRNPDVVNSNLYFKYDCIRSIDIESFKISPFVRNYLSNHRDPNRTDLTPDKVVASIKKDFEFIFLECDDDRDNEFIINYKHSEYQRTFKEC